MSKLDELIQQLCPDGVEWKCISDIGVLVRGNGLQKKDFTESGCGCIHYGQIYTYYGTSTDYTKSFVSTELSATLTKVDKGNLVIACTSENIEDVCKSVAWLGSDQIVTGGHACVFKHYENPKYISYCFQTEWFFNQKRKYARGTKVIDIKTDDLGKIMLPIPPLPVQEEIVRLLDQLTKTTQKYQAELETELDARKKQYEEYRNQLLDLEGKEGVEMKTLEDASLKITDGSHSSPKSTTEGYYMPSVKDMTDTGFDFSKCKIISKFDFDILKRNGCCPQKNDVLIAKDGSMLRYVFSVKENMDIALLSSIAIIRPKDIIQPDFMAYYFKQAKIRDKVIREYGKGGGVPRIILKNFKKIYIPIPPLSEQERIVNILDRMDKAHKELCQSIETEIKMRKQQYEYYRNQLLDFKKKEN